MGNRVFGVAVDCANAATLAEFWSQVLGRPMADGETIDSAVVPADDDPAHGPRLGFHRVPEPKTSKNRLHLDLITSDFDAETARLLALGAVKVKEICQNGARWLTFLDIEGNEFDLIAG
jgi:predicted enzyme related to lactoylglutathione lyase